MKMYKPMSNQKRVTTNSKTEKSTGHNPESLYGYGNDGNTYSTKLPKHGCPKGAKKPGKRRKGY